MDRPAFLKPGEPRVSDPKISLNDFRSLNLDEARTLKQGLKDGLDGSNLTSREEAFAATVLERLQEPRPYLTHRQIATARKIVKDAECCRW